MTHVAAIGPPELLDVCAPDAVDGLAVTRIDAPTADAIAAAQPDAVVAFAPSEDLSAAIDEIEAPALLWWPGIPPPWARIARERRANGLRRTIVGQPQAPDGTWRSVPLPVADGQFDATAAGSGAAWLDPPSARREEYLRHFRHPVPIAEDDCGGGIAVSLREHDRDGAALHRAHVALAQGRLLVGDPLVPSRGLEAGIDYVAAYTLDDIHLAVENALRSPAAFARVRTRGRRKAELFRSSTVVARLVGDLLLETGTAPARATG